MSRVDAKVEARLSLKLRISVLVGGGVFMYNKFPNIEYTFFYVIVLELTVLQHFHHPIARMFKLTTLVALASVATTVLATPPACLLACVAKVEKSSDCSGLNDLSCICSDNYSDVEDCLNSICPNDTADSAISAFEDSCSGYSVNKKSSSSSAASSTSASSSAAASSSSSAASSSAAATSSSEATSSSAAATSSSSSAAASSSSAAASSTVATTSEAASSEAPSSSEAVIISSSTEAPTTSSVIATESSSANSTVSVSTNSQAGAAANAVGAVVAGFAGIAALL